MPLLPAGEGHQGAVFLGVKGYLASLVAFRLDYLDYPLALTDADDPHHGNCSLWLPLTV